MFLYDLGGPGPLQTINIPIGILRFSAWDRQDHPKTTKNWILQYFLKGYQKKSGFNEINVILVKFCEFPPFGDQCSKNTNIP